MRKGGEMYKDPQDMFGDMDELFAYLSARMMREFPLRESRAFQYSDLLERDVNSSLEHGLVNDELRPGSEPGVEVHRIDDEVKVITELPGVTRDTLHLTMKENRLFIDAYTGTLQYHTSAILPPVETEPLQVSLKNGVLEVTFAILTGIPDYELA
jgi:HSP20 family molecular chaperone IbpA